MRRSSRLDREQTAATPAGALQNVGSDEDAVTSPGITASNPGVGRIYLDISTEIEASTGTVEKKRDDRARKRPKLTLSSWQTLNRLSNPVREERVKAVMGGEPILPIASYPNSIPAGDEGEPLIPSGITLEELKQCLPGKERLSACVIEWLIGCIRTLPQLVDTFIYPTKTVELLEKRDANVDLDRQLSEFHWGAGGQPRRLMAFGKVLVPFSLSEDHWCLAYIQPPVKKCEIQIFSSKPVRLSPNLDRKLKLLRNFFAELQRREQVSTVSHGVRWTTSIVDRLPRQSPECDDSGSFLCAYAKCLVTGQDPGECTAAAVNLIRVRMLVLGLELASTMSI